MQANDVQNLQNTVRTVRNVTTLEKSQARAREAEAGKYKAENTE